MTGAFSFPSWLDVSDAFGAGLGEMLLVLGDAAVLGIDHMVGFAEAMAFPGTLADLASFKKVCPVDIQQEEVYAPVVYLKEKTWLLPAGKFCKVRST